jgi:putative RNA 2'-phosphotransferase
MTLEVATTHNAGMETQKIVRISKSMSRSLRHQPERLGITLEPGGWVRVDDLLSAMKTTGLTLTRAQLEEVVANNDKQRFSFDETGTRIRANQGHSVTVDLQLEPRSPPNVLYHGTNEAALPGILETGLQRMKRHHVHLSADTETAHRVGSRRGRVVILKLDAAAMNAAGHVFFRSANGVWLTDEVPTQFLEVLKPS